jgi:hypothetical protein
MRKQLRSKFFLIAFFLPVQLFAQDITGLWKGEMYVDSTKKYLPYEISISEVKGKLTGYSLIMFEENGKLETGIRDITIERKDDQVIIEDVSLIDNSFSFVPPKNIKKTMVVTLMVDDTSMTLKGNWSTNRTKRFLAATGSVQLQRKNDYKAAALYKRLEVLKLSDNIVFKEPEKKPAPVIAMAPPPLPAPVTVARPAEEKKQPVAVKETPPPPVVVAAPKPVEVKKETQLVVRDAPPKPPVAAANKPAEVKPAPPVIVKPAPVKPAPVPAVVAVAKPAEVKKQPPLIARPLPPPVVSAPVVQQKPKEVVEVIAEKKQAPAIMPSVAQGAADVDKRSTATTQTVYYEQDSLLLTLYDNGDVDGDTVSVLMNGEVIFSKQGLSTKANSKKIAVSSDSVQMIMYAENLGSIPPNTGLLIVMDGEKRYEVRFSADLKTNAAILFRRKKINN